MRSLSHTSCSGHPHWEKREKVSLLLVALAMGALLMLIGCPPLQTADMYVTATIFGDRILDTPIMSERQVFSGNSLEIPPGGRAQLAFVGVQNHGATLDYIFRGVDGRVNYRSGTLSPEGIFEMSPQTKDESVQEEFANFFLDMGASLNPNQKGLVIAPTEKIAIETVAIIALLGMGDVILYSQTFDGFTLAVPMGYAVSQIIVTQHTSLGDFVIVLNASIDVTFDGDNDGLPDSWEYWFWGNLTGCIPGADPDNDGLSSREEYDYLTNPLLFDTDHDGFGDGAEVIAGTDPLDPNSYPAPQRVSIPNVVGQTEVVARTNITTAGLVVGTVTMEASITVPVGRVIRTNPTGGTLVSSGSSVNLVVSSGPPNPQQISVPNVVGQTEVVARTNITTAGLVVGTVTMEASITVPVGRVIRTNPTGGTLVSSGSSVNLVISEGVLSQAGVWIIDPAPGMVYHVGNTVALTIKVKGATGGGPYTLRVQNGEFKALLDFNLGSIGTAEVIIPQRPSFTFSMATNGSLFQAILYDRHTGSPVLVAESDVAYSVVIP